MMQIFVSAHALEMKDSVLFAEGESVPDTVQMAVGDEALSIDGQRVDDVTGADSIPVLPEHEREIEAILQNIDTTAVRFSVTADSLLQLAVPQEKGRFIPDPKKAMWLAMIIPGGGQIYNRKYWKLPIVYGGFIGCVYAMTWNNTMYRDYSQAYIDIMDSDENTKSYENFLPDHYDVTANMDRLKELFKRKKNYYRRYRDLSMFCMIGVYALSIIDAYVDAEMSSFDISDDLSLKVNPTIINEKHSVMKAQGLSAQSYGLQCSLSF
ncbi:MAG: DUF5683 domain-containing protein [Bacteroidaceae bacterium]|nr:DUF5683 domain-containing protein [Bacteroidaceae bacterium]